jgi:hypothetical protein
VSGHGFSRAVKTQNNDLSLRRRLARSEAERAKECSLLLPPIPAITAIPQTRLAGAGPRIKNLRLRRPFAVAINHFRLGCAVQLTRGKEDRGSPCGEKIESGDKLRGKGGKKAQTKQYQYPYSRIHAATQVSGHGFSRAVKAQQNNFLAARRPRGPQDASCSRIGVESSRAAKRSA